MAEPAVSTRTPDDWASEPVSPLDELDDDLIDRLTTGNREDQSRNVAIMRAFLGDRSGPPIASVPQGKTPEGLAAALDTLHVGLRFNTRAMREEYLEDADVKRPGKSDEWTPLSDRAAAKIRAIIAGLFTYETKRDENTPLAFGRETWADGVNAMLYNRETDPFVEWLDALPEWDGIPRLEAWLPILFDIEDDALPLAHWAARTIPLGAVWRAYRPGTKIDSTVVLVGSGGIGKSTAIRYLLPPARQSDWFSDSLRFDTDVKVQTEALQNRVIVEASEMQGSTRAEIGNMKSVLSRTDDGSVRLAYRRNPEPSPRRCVIVGTTDKEQSLPNDPNNRRFVPVKLAGRANLGELVEYMDAERSQIWAEAVHRYHRGETAHLPPDLEGLQRDAVEDARHRDVGLEDAIDAYLDTAPMHLKTSEFLVGIGIAESVGNVSKVSSSSQARAAFRALRVRGYENRNVRIDGAVKRRWVMR